MTIVIDNDDDDDDEDEEDVDESKWGKKKDYYFTDFVDDELGDSEDEEYGTVTI